MDKSLIDQLRHMTGRELILAAFNHQPLPRVPWIPYTGVHVGSLKGYTAASVLKDEQMLYDSLIEAHKLYHPDALPVIFDLQMEAEILGCDLIWAEKSPPSVSTHPLEFNKTIPDYLPTAGDGRIPLVLNVMRRLKASIGKTTALYGLLCGPLTLASHLRGMNLFMDMYEDPDYVQNLLLYCRQVFNRLADLYMETGMDVLAAVDPLVSQISPMIFEQYLTKPFIHIFNHIRSQGKFSSFFVCGDATKNIEVMCHTQPDCISIDENIDILTAKKITDAHHIIISGNIPLTSVLLLGNQKDNQKYAVELIERLGTKNFILAPGCDMPYDTPKENLIGISHAVQDSRSVKRFLENYERKVQTIKVDLPAYDQLNKPLIEVFTVDSASCAACGYMKAAAMEMLAEFPDQINVVEYKITAPENIYRVEKLGIKNLPSILINGKLAFSSLIPSRAELREEIKKQMK